MTKSIALFDCPHCVDEFVVDCLELRDRRNVFSYCLKRLALLIMIGDFQNGGNFPSVPTFRPHVSCVLYTTQPSAYALG